MNAARLCALLCLLPGLALARSAELAGAATAAKPELRLQQGRELEQQGKLREALLAYMSVYHQQLGNVRWSAPACLAMAELMWRRNLPAEGKVEEGRFRHSDRWTAWNLTHNYVEMLRRSGLEERLSPADRELFLRVEQQRDLYAADAAVQAEENTHT